MGVGLISSACECISALAISSARATRKKSFSGLLLRFWSGSTAIVRRLAGVDAVCRRRIHHITAPITTTSTASATIPATSHVLFPREFSNALVEIRGTAARPILRIPSRSPLRIDESLSARASFSRTALQPRQIRLHFGRILVTLFAVFLHRLADDRLPVPSAPPD